METTDLVYRSESNEVVTDSRIVAEVFGRQHCHVLRDIRSLSCSKDFHRLNFELMVEMRQLPQGGAQKTEHYTMTKDGFTFLVMGYTGAKAAQFKEAYINAFNQMEGRLKETARIESRVERLEDTIRSMETTMRYMESTMRHMESIVRLSLESKAPEAPRPAHRAPVQRDLFSEQLVPVRPVVVSTQALPEVACKAPVFYSVEELRAVGIQTFTMRVFRNRLNRELHVTYTSKMLFAWLRWRGFLVDDDVYIHLPSYECYTNAWIFACGSGSFRPNGKKHTVPHFTEKGYRHISNLFKTEIYDKNKTIEV